MKRLLAAFLLLSLLLSGCAATPVQEESLSTLGTLSIHYIDVNHADCTLLIAGDTTVLIDGGNTDTSRDVLDYLKQFGVDQIDLMVNTHPHGDHLGGLPLVLNNIPTDEIWCSTTTFDTYLFEDFSTIANQKGLEIQRPAIGTKFEENNLSITVLGPWYHNDTYFDLNDTSLVLMVQFGERKFLFTGDMEALAEKQLVDANVDLKADVLKVGHHGSYSSTSQVFLDKVDPDYGVVFCAWGNEYGHPHDGPMNRLEQSEVKLYRTDLMGSVVILTDGSELAFFLETTNTQLTGYEKPA